MRVRFWGIRPRHVDADAMSLLRNIAALAELELQRTNEQNHPSGSAH